MTKRLKVLLIAEAANPEWVSVPLVGWSLVSHLAKKTDAHIVTQIRNRDAFVRAGMRDGIDFTAIDSEKIMAPAGRLVTLLGGNKGVAWTLNTAIASLAYPYFERLVWARFGKAIKCGEFDLVHRVTPLTPTAPSSLARRCAKAGVPFLMGPLNGGVPWPREFDAERRREKEWLSYVRSAYRLLPGIRSTMKNSAAILVGSRHTMGEVPQAFQHKCVYMPENGIDPARFYRRAAPESDGVLRLCFVGRLVPYKGPDMLLEALTLLLRDGKVTLEIVGDGPMMSSLKEVVEAENVGSSVRFHGWVSHTQVQDVICRCHLLALPSIREFGGGVVLEAMALGVVPLVVDYAGPGELIDEEVGFKVPLGTRQDIVSGFRDKVASIAASPDQLPKLMANARDRILKCFTWDAKAEQLVRLYSDVLTGGNDRALSGQYSRDARN